MKFTSTITWVVALLMPFAITMLGVRILLLPAFLDIEYRMPGFPEDPHGFKLHDRLMWARPTVDHLTHTPSSLSSLEFAPNKPVFNERELSHLSDVKNILQPLLQLWYITLALLLLLALFSWWLNGLAYYISGMRYGGWLTVGIIGTITIAAFISFDQFFSKFHELLFSEDSWLFYETDTLIRLFPIRFWQDCIVYLALFWLIIGLLFGIFSRKPSEN